MGNENKQTQESLFQENVYEILRQGNSGERYRKKNTDEAIVRILQDEELFKCLGKRQISLSVSTGLENLIKKAKEELRHSSPSLFYSENILVGGGKLKLQLKLGLQRFYGWGDDGEYTTIDCYTASPQIELNKRGSPVLNFSQDCFKYESSKEEWARMEHSKKVRDISKRLKKIIEKPMGEEKRVSDLIITTGKRILTNLETEIKNYVEKAEYKIGRI